MLDLYEITGEQREALLQVAREAQEKGWWQAYSDTLVVPLVGLETAAASIRIYEAIVVPGLLQIADYAHAVINATRPDLLSEQIERWVELRMARRRSLFSQEHPPTLTAVIDESVLRRTVGGPDTMPHQLSYLAEVAARPAVTLRVLPLGAGEHAGMSGSFTVFGFSEPADPDVVYLEHITSDVYLEDAQEVQRYAKAFDQLCSLALPPEDSIKLLISLAEKRDS